MDIVKREAAVFNVPIPWLIGICFDCTSSISNSDFKTAQRELGLFLINVHERAQRLQGLPSDFVSITAFKGCGDIYGPAGDLGIVKMDEASKVIRLCQWLAGQKNDGGATALYDAILVASTEIVQLDKQLPYNYLKVIMAITDGQDNNSRTKLGQLSYFAQTDLCLSVVGVGSGSSSELRKLSAYATTTHSISHFGDLFEAMSISLRKVVETTTHYRL